MGTRAFCLLQIGRAVRSYRPRSSRPHSSHQSIAYSPRRSGPSNTFCPRLHKDGAEQSWRAPGSLSVALAPLKLAARGERIVQPEAIRVPVFVTSLLLAATPHGCAFPQPPCR